MSLKDDLKSKVDEHLKGEYKTVKKTTVPMPEDIPLGPSAALLEATTLFIDIRQSSDIATAFRRQTAAKMMKAYFSGAVAIVNKNNGYVRSFNGDGMLAIFIGDRRSNNAVKAAMQVKWFVQEILDPKFSKYFENNQQAVGQALSFRIGAGLDEGHIYAVRVGIKGTNDVAWIGRNTNTSAKLSNIVDSPKSIAITRAVFDRLFDDRKYSDGKMMWGDEEFHEFGGVTRAIRRTSYWWSIT